MEIPKFHAAGYAARQNVAKGLGEHIPAQTEVPRTAAETAEPVKNPLAGATLPPQPEDEYREDYLA